MVEKSTIRTGLFVLMILFFGLAGVGSLWLSYNDWIVRKDNSKD